MYVAQQQQRGNMLVIQQNRVSTNQKPAAIATAPMPMNTPSQYKESNGRDGSITLVPSSNSSAIWGGAGMTQSAPSPTERPATEPSRSTTMTMTSKPSQAPWAKAATTTTNPAATTSAPPVAQGSPKISASRPSISAGKNWADEESDDDDVAPAPMRPRFLPQATPEPSNAVGASRQPASFGNSLASGTTKDHSQSQSGPSTTGTGVGVGAGVFNKTTTQFVSSPPSHSRLPPQQPFHYQGGPQGGQTGGHASQRFDSREPHSRERSMSNDYGDRDSRGGAFAGGEDNAWRRGVSLPPAAQQEARDRDVQPLLPPMAPHHSNRQGPQQGVDNFNTQRPLQGRAPFHQQQQSYQSSVDRHDGPGGYQQQPNQRFPNRFDQGARNTGDQRGYDNNRIYSNFDQYPSSRFGINSHQQNQPNFEGRFRPTGPTAGPYRDDGRTGRPRGGGSFDDGMQDRSNRVSVGGRGGGGGVDEDDSEGQLAAQIEATRRERERVERLKLQQQQIQQQQLQQQQHRQQQQQSRSAPNSTERAQWADRPLRESSRYNFVHDNDSNTNATTAAARPLKAFPETQHNPPSRHTQEHNYPTSAPVAVEDKWQRSNRPTVVDPQSQRVHSVESPSKEAAISRVVESNKSFASLFGVAKPTQPSQAYQHDPRLGQSAHTGYSGNANQSLHYPLMGQSTVESLHETSFERGNSRQHFVQNHPNLPNVDRPINQPTMAPTSILANPNADDPTSARKKMLYDPKSSQLVDAASREDHAGRGRGDGRGVRAGRGSERREVSAVSRVKITEKVEPWKRAELPKAIVKREAKPTRRRTENAGDDDDDDYEDIEDDNDIDNIVIDESEVTIQKSTFVSKKFVKGPPASANFEKSSREIEQDAAKLARQKERESRTPRTHGWLFKYNAAGEIEQVLMEGEPSTYEVTVPPKQSVSILNNKFTSTRPTPVGNTWQNKSNTRDTSDAVHVDENADGDDESEAVGQTDKVSKQLIHSINQKRFTKTDKPFDKSNAIASKKTKVSFKPLSRPKSARDTATGDKDKEKDKKWERVAIPTANPDEVKPPTSVVTATRSVHKKPSPRGQGKSKPECIPSSDGATQAVVGATLRDARKSSSRSVPQKEETSTDATTEAGVVKGDEKKSFKPRGGKRDGPKGPPAVETKQNNV